MRLRDQRYVTLSQSSKQLVGPNTRRKALIITAPSSPTDEANSTSTINGAVDTSTTGVKSNYTVPAGQLATLLGATFVETTGTGVVARVQVVRSGTTINLATFTTSGYYGGFALLAGDVVQWNVTTAVGASVSDFTLSVAPEQLNGRVTISFIGPAVVDQGINLAPGGMPLVLSAEHYGDALQNEVYAIANAGSPTIGVVDIFGP